MFIHSFSAHGGKLEGIQVLRAVAAWLVVFHHFHQAFNQFDRSTSWGRVLTECGDYAVYVFFVISGFVIHYSLSAQPRSGWVFLESRLRRIVPAYWVATLIFSAVIFFIFPPPTGA